MQGGKAMAYNEKTKTFRCKMFSKTTTRPYPKIQKTKKSWITSCNFSNCNMDNTSKFIILQFMNYSG